MGILTAAIFIVLGIGVQRFLIDPQGFLGDGALIVCENSDRIFLISEGIKHAIPNDPALAQELGLKLDKIVQVSCDFENQFPEGIPLEDLLGSEDGIQFLSKIIWFIFIK